MRNSMDTMVIKSKKNTLSHWVSSPVKETDILLMIIPLSKISIARITMMQSSVTRESNSHHLWAFTLTAASAWTVPPSENSQGSLSSLFLSLFKCHLLQNPSLTSLSTVVPCSFLSPLILLLFLCSTKYT